MHRLFSLPDVNYQSPGGRGRPVTFTTGASGPRDSFGPLGRTSPLRPNGGKANGAGQRASNPRVAIVAPCARNEVHELSDNLISPPHNCRPECQLAENHFTADRVSSGEIRENCDPVSEISQASETPLLLNTEFSTSQKSTQLLPHLNHSVDVIVQEGNNNGSKIQSKDGLPVLSSFKACDSATKAVQL